MTSPRPIERWLAGAIITAEQADQMRADRSGPASPDRAHGDEVEGPAVEEVDHQHVVAILAQPIGGVADPLPDTKHRVKERDRRHETTEPSDTDTVQTPSRARRALA